MARKKQKNKKKKLIWLLVVVLVAAGVGGYFVVSSLNNKEENKEETSEYKEEKNEDESIDEEDVAEKAVEEKKVVQYEGEDANNSDSLTGVVTYAAVVGDKVTIRVSIDQYLSSGTCGLTLTRSGATVYSSIANIVGSASTSTCEGFDVPTSELGGGAMEIIINLNSGDRKGVIRGEVNI